MPLEKIHGVEKIDQGRENRGISSVIVNVVNIAIERRKEMCQRREIARQSGSREKKRRTVI